MLKWHEPGTKQKSYSKKYWVLWFASSKGHIFFLFSSKYWLLMWPVFYLLGRGWILLLSRLGILTNILRKIQRWWNAFVVVSELLAHPILTPVWKVFTSQSCIQSPKEIWWNAFLHSQETQSFDYLPPPEWWQIRKEYSFLLILMIKEENTRKIFSDASVEMTKSLINYRKIIFDLVWAHSLVVRVRKLASLETFYSLVILWGTFTYVIQSNLLSIIISPPVSDEMS